MAAARTPNPAKAWREPEAFHSAALKCCQELAGLSSQLECGGEVGSRRSGAGATTSSVPFGGHFAVRLRAKQVRRPPQSRLSRTHPRNPLPTTPRRRFGPDTRTLFVRFPSRCAGGPPSLWGAWQRRGRSRRGGGSTRTLCGTRWRRVCKLTAALRTMSRYRWYRRWGALPGTGATPPTLTSRARMKFSWRSAHS